MVRKVSKPLEPDEEELKNKMRAIEEIELRKLLRQNRMMKETKVKDTIIEKQTKVVHALKDEKNNLVNNLNVMKSFRRCILDGEQTHGVELLFQEGDKLDAEIAEEKKYLEDLKAKIRADSVSLERLRKEKKELIMSLLSDARVKEEKDKADRSLHSWQLRLHSAQEQLSKATTENARLRERINILLKEKESFNKLFEEIMKKLKKGKQIMKDVVEQAKSQFQRKDEIVYKIEALKTRDRADLAKKMEEIQEMEIKLYEDKKLAAFKHKLQVARVRMVGNVRQSTKERETRQQMAQKLQRFLEFWDDLKQHLGLNTAEEICDMITKEDTALFSLFNFNNEIRDELEFMIQKVAEMLRQVDEEQLLADERRDKEIKYRDALLNKLTTLEAKVIDKKERCEANERMFDRLLSKVRTLFDLLRCDPSPLFELLGKNAEVTEHNYNLYLNLIESEIMFLLDLVVPETKPARTQTIGKTTSAMMLASRSMTTRMYTTVSALSTVVLDKKVITRTCNECDPIALKRFN